VINLIDQIGQKEAREAREARAEKAAKEAEARAKHKYPTGQVLAFYISFLMFGSVCEMLGFAV
jgi:hypothetical protein